MMMMNYGLTDLEDLHHDDINLVSIAQALARINRFAGNFSSISVAQHAYVVSALVARMGGDAKEQLAALHHDDAEAFIGDIPSPVKQLCPDIQVLENEILTLVDEKYEVKTRSALIKKVDKIVTDRELMLNIELNPALPRMMSVLRDAIEDKKVIITASTLTPWEPARAIAAYLDLHDDLMREITVEKGATKELALPAEDFSQGVN